MDRYFEHQVLDPGEKPLAHCISWVPEEAAGKDWNSSDSELKKYLPTSAEDESNFAEVAAGILGWIACALESSECFNDVGFSNVPEWRLLPKKPADLGEPSCVVLEDKFHGVKMWIKTTGDLPTYRQPASCTKSRTFR
jgi:hypothetical protein